MAPPTSNLLLFTAALLLCAGCATAAKQCPLCGTNEVPYPLSTGSDCGDQNYKIRCDAGALKFDTLNNTYSITSVNPSAQRLVIQPSSFVGNTCITADLATQGFQMNGSLPFNITSSNTIMYLNCSDLALSSPVNCSSTSLCHTYINGTAAGSACENAPICCTFRAGGSTTSYRIRVRESGCRAYRSFVNLDPSLALSRWPQPGLEIQWESPPEPLCETQSDCDSNSTCGSDPSGNGLRRCYCNSDLRWDPISGSCARSRFETCPFNFGFYFGPEMFVDYDLIFCAQI